MRVLSFLIALHKSDLDEPAPDLHAFALAGLVHSFHVEELPTVADPWFVIEVEHDPAQAGAPFDVRLTMQGPSGGEHELAAGSMSAARQLHPDAPPVSILLWRPYFALSAFGGLTFRVYLDGELAFARTLAVVPAATPRDHAAPLTHA